MTSRFLLLALLLLGCSGGDSAPSISNLTYSPQTVTAGAANIFDVTFDFDTSSDLTTIEFSLVQSPAGPTKTPQTFPISNAAGIRQGTLDAQLDVTFATPGSYTIGLDVVDDAQRASNQLTGTIVAQ
jgi:hypothetical protein